MAKKIVVDYKFLFISLLLPQLVGIFGSIFTIQSIPVWYASLNKPSFSPPNNVFGPVWGTLYLLMGIALYLVWIKSKKSQNARFARNLFFLHLFFNFLWSFLFFGLRSPLVGFVDIVFLWVMIVMLIKLFYKVDRISSYLLVPYLLWVTFASVLNLAIVILN